MHLTASTNAPAAATASMCVVSTSCTVPKASDTSSSSSSSAAAAYTPMNVCHPDRMLVCRARMRLAHTCRMSSRISCCGEKPAAAVRPRTMPARASAAAGGLEPPAALAADVLSMSDRKGCRNLVWKWKLFSSGFSRNLADSCFRLSMAYMAMRTLVLQHSAVK